MRKQLSIVLVEGDHVPRELSALLVGMGVWVKSTWSTGLEAALTQTTPHLVVCGDPSQLPLLKRAISETHPGTPLLLIADWDLTRARRAIATGLVEDLIPESLPATDIARRLETLAARRAARAPSRATLTPPTRAGIHPLLPLGVGRDDRTPESRQDNPIPSRRPPPPPVRVASHAPSPKPPAIQSAPAAPSGSLAQSVPPPPPRPRFAEPAQGPSSLAPLTASLTASLPPGLPATLTASRTTSTYPTHIPPAQTAALWAQTGSAPGSVPPSALSPDSAPPIQMITKTAQRPRRHRRSGPGFTLGAALGVAASAAAFVGVIEFERDLRVLTAQSATRLQAFAAEHQTRLPKWLSHIAEYVPGVDHQAGDVPRAAASLAPIPAAPAVAAPLELKDLGAVETDFLGMGRGEAKALFEVADTRLASCEEMLSGWQAPLPMIEEDRPEHGAVHRRRAQEHLVAGEPKMALRDLCKSASIDPSGAGTETLASVYLSLRSLEQAETWIKRFLADSPRSDSGRDLLGDIENQRGRVGEARAVWLAVLGLDAEATGMMREVARHWVQDATLALGASDLAQAERKLRRALTLDPTSAHAASLLSRVLDRQGLTVPSLAWAKRARELEH